MKKYLKEYCVGCGLCEAAKNAHITEDESGFYHPKDGDENWLAKVCPASGIQQQIMVFKNIWGRYQSVYYGWSSDANVRKVASSGGVLTEIASWLLENGKVDGIVHTCADPVDPTKTVSCISNIREDLIFRSGSRYTISHPLEVLDSLDKTKLYAFIGKPCDVVVLQNYMMVQPEWKEIIVYTLSFFCAGLPSKLAQEKLLMHLECPKRELQSLRYRGEGWPGYTVAIERSGKEHRTDYATSWGQILGRDIMKMCRFCLDGIGETADISCGDAWYLTPDKKPDFTEADGRNIIFARTEKGNELLEDVIADGKICVEPAVVNELKYIQPYQWDRRATMADKIFAMRLFAKSIPHYKYTNIRQYYGEVGLKRHFSILKGSVKRILKKKI